MSTVRKVPLRKCIGCNEMKNKKEMIRVLKTADDTIEIDAERLFRTQPEE